MDKKPLTLSDNRLLGGVCAGIAEYFNFDPTMVRIAYAILTIICAGFPGIILYPILYWIIPSKNKQQW
jgi:phage shock protein PspC (stress-responsive transcriptional regulator)